MFGISHEIFDKVYSQDTRQLDTERTNATLPAHWHSFLPKIDQDLTVSLFTPSEKWQTLSAQSGLTWPMANNRPHATQILDRFQVIDTVCRLSSFVWFDFWHSDQISGEKESQPYLVSFVAAVILFLKNVSIYTMPTLTLLHVDTPWVCRHVQTMCMSTDAPFSRTTSIICTFQNNSSKSLYVL